MFVFVLHVPKKVIPLSSSVIDPAVYPPVEKAMGDRVGQVRARRREAEEEGSEGLGLRHHFLSALPHPHPGFAHLLPSREKVTPQTSQSGLLPLWEKVPEGRMRGGPTV